MTYTVNSTSADVHVPSSPERELRNALDDGSLAEIEIAWSDPFGHAQGKRIPATQFLNRALGTGFAFCEASLGWDTEGTVVASLRLTNWSGGYPDVYAVPDLATYRTLPWRPRVGHVSVSWGLIVRFRAARVEDYLNDEYEHCDRHEQRGNGVRAVLGPAAVSVCHQQGECLR